MSNSFEEFQEEVLEFLRDELAQPVYETGIPDGHTVKRNKEGRVDPYVAVQFGDVYASGARSFLGAVGHDYSMPISIQVLSPTPTIGRRISNRIVSLLLGRQFSFAPGGVEKRPVGGAILTISEADSASEVYMVPSWYRVTVQFFNED